MTTLLLENLKTKISSLELEPAGGGVFEVFIDGEQIYSKAATGDFPEEADILDEVLERA